MTLFLGLETVPLDNGRLIFKQSGSATVIGRAATDGHWMNLSSLYGSILNVNDSPIYITA